jgi:hypothetical protein
MGGLGGADFSTLGSGKAGSTTAFTGTSSTQTPTPTTPLMTPTGTTDFTTLDMGVGVENVATPPSETFLTSSKSSEWVKTAQAGAQALELAAQRQAGDVQLNAAASLPSISNVGSFAPTGVVNWNAIPGGFQPLPQAAGGKKKLYQLSQFHGGINQSSSPRDIADFECQEASNVTFSQVGRIKLLGDCLNETNSLKEFAATNTSGPNLPGYGLFEFKAPVDVDGAAGETTILLTADGDQVDSMCTNIAGSLDTNQGWIDIGGAGSDDGDEAQIYYAAGNGVYVADANFVGRTTVRAARIYVSRNDINAQVDISGWETGAPLLSSPHYEDNGTTPTRVELNTSHVDAGATGRFEVTIINSGTGTWDGTYYFYLSWLFDGGCETGLTAIGTGDTFSNETCHFNVSMAHNNNDPCGGSKRINGARIYFKKSGTSERWLLGEVSLIDGVKGALDSTFTPWYTAGTSLYDLEDEIIFENPPEVYSYASLNGYYANEVYTKSPDATGTRSDPIPVHYKTCVVGQAGIVFIGNVMFDSKHMPDSMMFSMPGKPAVFPKFNVFDSPSSDGSGITALAAFQDKILQFKQNAMYVINVSNPAQFYAQSSFRDCGVFNSCQVFTTSFGVIFVNKNGCFIYDGQKVISLTGGKFDWLNQSGVSEATSNISTAQVPCIGYDPRSQSIIILKNIGDDADTTSLTNEGAWVYNMATQSWTEGSDMIINGNGVRHTNFIITSEGYLSIKASNDATLLNYNHDKSVDTGAQTITYITKDLDFGLPTQTKKIFKIYVTYKGDGSSVTVTYGADGDTTPTEALTNSENSGATLTSAGVTDHNVATFTLNSHPSALKSIALKFTGSAAADFEINDISILYRVRPIK